MLIYHHRANVGASFTEDMICGLLGGAMGLFNAGAWLLPHFRLLTAEAVLWLCLSFGILTMCLLACARSNSRF